MSDRQMIRFEAGGVRFNMRLVAVILAGERVLVHRTESESFWSLPGGRAELLETTRDGLAREMTEELDTEVEVGRLLWLVENFFEYEGMPYHELGLYFLVTLPLASSLLASDAFPGYEGSLELIFRWAGLNELDHMVLLPSFLKVGLRNLPTTTQHIVHHDEIIS